MLKKQLEKEFKDNPFLNLKDAVYRLLYQNIINLTLKPGSALSETSLAKELDLSRTPIRNALMQLQKNGLVSRNKGQSFFVMSIEKEECKQLMEARLAIEGQAAYLAVERIVQKDLSKLEECMRGYQNACKNWNIEEIIMNDHAFHQMIIDSSHNPFIADVYHKLEPRVLHYRHFLFEQAAKERVSPIMEVSVRNHLAIYHAIKLGFSSVAKERMERDISGMVDIVKNW